MLLPRFRDIDLQVSGKVLAGEGLLVPLDLGRGALRNHISAVQPCAGPHVHDMIGTPDGVLIVLDHDQGISRDPGAAGGCRSVSGCPSGGARSRVRRGRRGPHQVRPDLGGKPDPLGFPTG